MRRLSNEKDALFNPGEPVTPSLLSATGPIMLLADGEKRRGFEVGTETPLEVFNARECLAWDTSGFRIRSGSSKYSSVAIA